MNILYIFHYLHYQWVNQLTHEFILLIGIEQIFNLTNQDATYTSEHFYNRKIILGTGHS